MQDCLATIPQYPNNIGNNGAACDVASSISGPDSIWFVREQLFFKCTFRPLCTNHYNRSSEGIPLNLVFFSAFEDLLPLNTGTMESNGIRKLYEASPTLYVGRIEDFLGLVPLFQFFLDDNTTCTIPDRYSAQQKQAFEFGSANGQDPVSHRGEPWL